GSGSTHLAATQLSAITSDIAHAILSNVGRAIRQWTAVPLQEFPVMLLDPFEPSQHIFFGSRRKMKADALVLVQLYLVQRLKYAVKAATVRTTMPATPPDAPLSAP